MEESFKENVASVLVGKTIESIVDACSNNITFKCEDGTVVSIDAESYFALDADYPILTLEVESARKSICPKVIKRVK